MMSDRMVMAPCSMLLFSAKQRSAGTVAHHRPVAHVAAPTDQLGRGPPAPLPGGMMPAPVVRIMTNMDVVAMVTIIMVGPIDAHPPMRRLCAGHWREWRRRRQVGCRLRLGRHRRLVGGRLRLPRHRGLIGRHLLRGERHGEHPERHCCANCRKPPDDHVPLPARSSRILRAPLPLKIGSATGRRANRRIPR
jgi:hypothetical protein